MITEIFIENRRVDITTDISSLLTFAIDDIKDFGNRHSTFSKTIVIPGTANNNQLFGSIFETGVSNDYDPSLDNIGINFNPAKSARALIFQDFFQTFKGTVRLLEIIKDKGAIEYEIALNGEITSLNVELTNKYLENLDFSAYDHVYNIANISASWDNPGGSGYYYPLIDYGTYSVNKHDWDIKTLRPALYVKEYLDKIFSSSNFRYSSALFDTDRFKSLIIPHNQKVLTIKSTTLLNQSSNTATIDILNISEFITISFIKNGISVFDYSTHAAGTKTIVSGSIIFNTGDTIKVEIDTFTFGIYEIIFDAGIGSIGAFTTSDNTTYTYAGATTVTTSITLIIDFDSPVPASPDPGYRVDYTSNINIQSSGLVSVPVSYTDPIVTNDTIPKNIKQIDFIVSIVKLFNLYVYEDQFDERLIKFSPFVDYYTADASVSVDWTYKLDRDSPIKITPLSELNSKIYNFNYKDDSDYWNDLYKKRYNQGYGSKIFDSEFEFATNTSKVELIFAATPLVGYDGEEKIYPTIYKRNNDVEETTDSVIRIMQSKKVTGVTSWDILDGVTVLDSYTVYPYAGHFDDPDSPDNDLNFGLLQELFFALVAGDLTKTQFNLYWSAYMAEITDKDSKLLTAKFYLTAKDIFDLDFSTYIIVDSVLFRLNKIIDYNVTIPDLCTVELLKVINTSYSFPVGSFDSGIDRFLLWNDDEPLIDFDNIEMLYI